MNVIRLTSKSADVAIRCGLSRPNFNYSPNRRKVMKRKYRLVILLFYSLTIGWLTPAMASQAQTSRAASAASYLERGNQWLAKGEWERAIVDYDLAIAFDSRVAVAYYNRGVARQRKGDFAGALGDYNQAIELNPRYDDAYLN